MILISSIAQNILPLVNGNSPVEEQFENTTPNGENLMCILNILKF